MEESPKPEEQNILSDYYSGYQELELQAAEGEVRKARNALFLVAGLTLVVNLFLLSSTDSLSGFPLIIMLLLTAVFTGLALWTKRQPFTAIVIALIVYVGLWILDIVELGAENLIRGLFVKAIIIYILITALKHAREAERLRKEMKK